MARLKPVTWHRIKQGTGPTAPPTSPTHGWKLSPEIRGEYLHIAARKAAGATIMIWGFIGRGFDQTVTPPVEIDINEWFEIATFVLGGAYNEAEPLVAVGYERVAVQIVAGTAHVYLGEGG